MRLFVSEYLCSGAWDGPGLDGSLAREGRAMLRAIVDDCGRVPGVEVWTTWDRRLGEATFEKAHVPIIGSLDEERAWFDRLIRECDAVLLIAPEFHGILFERTRQAEAAGCRVVGPNSAAVEVCGDKYALAKRLQAGGVPTLETHLCDMRRISARDLPFPVVIKPREGAGSQETFLIRDAEELARFRNESTDRPLLERLVWQPYLPGAAISVALLMTPEGNDLEVLPVCTQHLSSDGRFRYLGGTVPVGLEGAAAAQRVAADACRQVPGLRGYVGVDLIVPHAASAIPVVVEINPRLTTSYLGYSALVADNLAERMLFPGRKFPALRWRAGSVSYQAGGTVTMSCDPRAE